MAGETPSRPPVDDPLESAEVQRLAHRRLASVRVAVGVPGFILLMFGLVLAFRLSGRPLGGPPFWWMLASLGAGLLAYLGYALLPLWKDRGGS